MVTLLKRFVDVNKKIMVVDERLHADEEAFLLFQGSNQDNLCGINLYPELSGDDLVEFDSMINLRPGRGNVTRGIDKSEIRSQILEIVSTLIK